MTRQMDTPFPRQDAVATQLTMEALRVLLSESEGFSCDRVGGEHEDDRLSDVEAEYGLDSIHSLNSDRSEFIDIPSTGSKECFNPSVSLGIWDGQYERTMDGEDAIAAELALMSSDDGVVDAVDGNNGVYGLRVVLGSFDDDRSFPFNSTVQHRNTTKLPEMIALLTPRTGYRASRDMEKIVMEKVDIEKIDMADPDLEKLDPNYKIKPTSRFRHKTITVLTTLFVAFSSLLLILSSGIAHSAIVALGLSLLLALVLLMIGTM